MFGPTNSIRRTPESPGLPDVLETLFELSSVLFQIPIESYWKTTDLHYAFLRSFSSVKERKWNLASEKLRAPRVVESVNLIYYI